MAVQYVSTTGACTVEGSTSQNISFVSTMPNAGDVVAAGGGVWTGSSATVSCSDNQTNSYTLHQVRGTGSATAYPINGSSSPLWGCGNVISSGTFTMTFSSSVNIYPTLGAVAFTNVDASPYDVSTGGFSTGTHSSQSTGTTGTTALDDSVAVITLDSGVAFANLAVTDYTISFQNGTDTTTELGALGYRILTSTGTQSATWTFDSLTGETGACIAVFKGSPQTAAPAIPIVQSVVMR